MPRLEQDHHQIDRDTSQQAAVVTMQVLVEGYKTHTLHWMFGAHDPNVNQPMLRDMLRRQAREDATRAARHVLSHLLGDNKEPHLEHALCRLAMALRRLEVVRQIES